ncbi:MAG: O-antigen ligase family protein [Clostridia bacterium]|nr:O-antigen ligase family protein [Clostridia bacterium]
MKKLKETFNKDINELFKKYFPKIISIYLLINIAYILFGSILFTFENITKEMFSEGYIFLLAFNIMMIVTIIITKQYRKSITHVFMILIIILGIISFKYAYNQKYALYGYEGRYEGLLTICYYITILFLSSFSEKKYRKIIVSAIVITGCIHAVYAIHEYWTEKTVFNVDGDIKIWNKGFTSNPNFFGTYMLLSLSCSIGLFIDETKKIIRLLFLIPIIILTIGLIISETMSCIVGFCAVMLFVIIYCLFSKKIKEIIVLVFIAALVLGILSISEKTNIVKDIIKTKDETVQMSNGNVDGYYGTGRIYVWKRAIKLVPKYWLHGIGIDNFYFINNGKPIKRLGYYVIINYDKAHNEYLQILITEGLFCLISYLLLYGIIVIKELIYIFKEKEVFLILPVLGYLIQAFFNISVIEVAPIFFIILGLGIRYKDKKERK